MNGETETASLAQEKKKKRKELNAKSFERHEAWAGRDSGFKQTTHKTLELLQICIYILCVYVCVFIDLMRPVIQTTLMSKSAVH